MKHERGKMRLMTDANIVFPGGMSIVTSSPFSISSLRGLKTSNSLFLPRQKRELLQPSQAFLSHPAVIFPSSMFIILTSLVMFVLRLFYFHALDDRNDAFGKAAFFVYPHKNTLYLAVPPGFPASQWKCLEEFLNLRRFIKPSH